MEEFQEKEKCTTNMVLSLDRGILIGICSRSTGEYGRIDTTTTKFRLFSSTIGVLMSGYSCRWTNVWNHLIDWGKSHRQPTVNMLATAAFEYMETHKSKGRYNASILFIGHEYVENQLVPCINWVGDRAAPPKENSDQVDFLVLKEKKIVAGTGSEIVQSKLNCCWRENMTFEMGYDVMKQCFLDAGLKDEDTRGIFRYFYFSPRCRTLRPSHVCDLYIEYFHQYEKFNENAIFVLCSGIQNPCPHLRYTLSIYGDILYNQCLFEYDGVTFHRIEFKDSKAVFSALENSNDGEFLVEPFCHFRIIELGASDGFIANIYISNALKSILEKVKEHLNYDDGLNYDGGP